MPKLTLTASSKNCAMTDREMLVIDVTPEERQQIEMLVRQHGYTTRCDYLLALVEDDEVEASFDADPQGAFRQAWHQAVKTKTEL